MELTRDIIALLHHRVHVSSHHLYDQGLNHPAVPSDLPKGNCPKIPPHLLDNQCHIGCICPGLHDSVHRWMQAYQLFLDDGQQVGHCVDNRLVVFIDGGVRDP